MKLLIIWLMLTIPLFAQDGPLILTEVIDANINRKDEGPQVHVFITLNLTGPRTFKADFYVSPEDVDAFKGGTAPEKAAIAKKYIRRAIRNYLLFNAAPAPPTDQGTQTMSKAQVSEAGDTP